MVAKVFAEVDYFEAWSRWMDHESLAGETLWGLEIFWWGRIGKVLQLVGGLTVVAEWIGADRIEDASKLLRQRRLRGLAHEAWEMSKDALRGYWRVLRGGGSPASQVMSRALTIIVGLLGLLPLLLPSYAEFLSDMQLALAFAIVLPLVPVIALMVAALLGRLLDLLLVRPLADLLAKGELVSWMVQLGGVLLLVVGIHFDLLAG